MTRVFITIDPEINTVEVGLKVDLTRIVGGPTAYYNLTQTPDEQRMINLEGALAKGVKLSCDNQQVVLDTKQVDFPILNLEDFKAIYAAPMTSIRWRGRINPAGKDLRFRIMPNLPIGTPIALTFLERQQKRTMTRWIEAGEVSQPFSVRKKVVTINRDLSPTPTEREKDITMVKWLNSAWIYLKLGFVHILPYGSDHILFVLGLFLFSVQLRPLLAQVTCFTFAHTITLALGIIGFLTPPAKVVEPLIAFSIAYIGFENIARAKPNPSRLVIISLFGLVHGLGFAGVLKDVGLPKQEFISALVFFNIGVEFGQIGVLLCAFSILGWFRKWRHFRKAILIPCSAVISVIGTVWAVARVMV
ncbi:MAG: hypothetical protein DF168_02229 [Candidatus Moanabacter tarae]|uniref:HupE / UreJ protein n=1 Tax=Candidatus Moanibacter tarae TaxID=2200854 RepID=A0A2Z4AKE4_9BACT|nr:MAG: hypothetical protein DF168_02229 [Candidatus Moanabacter tarae]|tara:strand:- start:46638 stop:47717 length:1080 start_codon:yes stop_codon:yes gene_type:complete